MIAPHGGKLVDRVLKGEERRKALERAQALPRIVLDRELAFEVENIATGVFSPLEGFLGKEDLDSVLARGRLADDLPWTIPIVLDVSREQARLVGDEVALHYRGQPVALLRVQETYSYDKEEMARGVYGTTSEEHPGVRRVRAMGEVLLGGTVDLLVPVPSPFPRYKLSPKETRVLFEMKGWRTVVGFQTRNVPHIGHEYVQKTALTFVDGLFINPVIGRKKPGDFKDEVIVVAYESLIEHYYLRDTAVMAILQMEMRYAGPREAIHHAVVRKNFGCTHFIVGRDHAGVGDFYHPYAAQEIFEDYPDIGIVPLFFRSFFYCKKCSGVMNEKICPHGQEHRVDFSGTRLRRMFQEGGRYQEEFPLIRPEVEEVLREHPDPFVR
ncbi:MAG TPA: sulfate adenylyltransferase [Candidatus Latescibacteria bacterium]|nr:sulfate adenylyltransferase [Candidatus Latescibacterota bacterium]